MHFTIYIATSQRTSQSIWPHIHDSVSCQLDSVRISNFKYHACIALFMASINRIPSWPQFPLMLIILHLCDIDLALSFCNVASSKWQTFVVCIIQMHFLQTKMNHRKARRITSWKTTVPLYHQCKYTLQHTIQK